MKKLLSFVIPCYRSGKTIEIVINEIIDTVSQRSEYDYEIICVNDFSPDNVYDVLKKHANENNKIKIINLSKNMGKHSAVMAGYSAVKGEIIVNLDDDFQSPVYELWRLIEPIENDRCDFATANYNKKKQSLLKNFGSNVNLYMSHIMLGKPLNLRFENLTAMKRFVMDAIIKYDNPYPYIEGLLLRVTRRIEQVPMEQRERADENKTGFTFKKSLSLWLNGLTAFSVKPLRIATVIGFIFAIIGFIFGLYVIITRLLNPETPAGYSSIMATLIFIGGIIMMLLGMIGEYLGRIYICINKSPQYVIKETMNLKQEEDN